MAAPHCLLGDLECKRLTVQDGYTYTGNSTVVGNETVGGTLTVTITSPVCWQMESRAGRLRHRLTGLL